MPAGHSGAAVTDISPFFLDYETRSELSLPDVGASRYASHPSTEIICLGWESPKFGRTGLWRPGENLPAAFHAAYDDPSTRFIAHNAGFDRRIWRHKFTQLEVPDVQHWDCSAVRASVNGLPRNLDEACFAAGLGYAKDADEAKALEKMMKPHRGQWLDTPELRGKVESRCLKDIRYMADLWALTQPLSDAEREWWLLDQEINDRGIPVDLQSCARIIEVLGELGNGGLYEHTRARLWEATGYQVASVTRLNEFKNWLLANDVALPNMQRQVIEEVLRTHTGLPEAARVALELKIAIGSAAPKKFKALMPRAEEDVHNPGYGWLRDSYICNGSHTGRDTAHGFQTQNMLRNTASLDEFELLLSGDAEAMLMLGYEPLRMAGTCVRPIVKALPGHKLVIGDFSKIETCVLFWFAECESGLQQIRAGHDLYCKQASAVFREEVTAKQPEKRQIGKHGVLGLGFGAAAEAFVKMCFKQAGIRVPIELGERSVHVYRREMFPEVPQYWYALEGVIRECIVKQCAKQFGKLKIAANKDILVIQLPSGRKLRYREPRVDADGSISYMGINPETTRWQRRHMWGGSFTENVVQGTANCLLREAAIRLTDNDYPLIMRSHDELVAHIEEEYANEEDFKAIMELKPTHESDWWYGIPLVVETKVLDRYGK
jgi:DNA polymerase